MPTQHYLLKDEKGSVAFLCGAVSAICEYFNLFLLERELPYFVASDVFEIDSGDKRSFDRSVRKRLSSYARNSYVDIPEGHLGEIEILDLSVLKTKETFGDALLNMICEHVVCDAEVLGSIRKLKNDIGFYFSKEKGIYRFKYFSALNNRIFNEFYSHEIHGAVLVEFDDYMLMIMLCS